MHYARLIALLFIIILTVTGCDVDYPKKSILGDSKELNQKIVGLQERLDSLENKISSLQSQQLDLFIDIYLLKSANKEAVFSPDSTGFQQVATNLGIFFISLKGIEKYANGYKIIFSIGNPYAAKFYDVDLVVHYGKSRPSDSKDTQTWLRSLKTKSINLTNELYPSSWNTVDIILSPASESEIEYISVTLSPSGVVLIKDKNQTE